MVKNFKKNRIKKLIINTILIYYISNKMFESILGLIGFGSSGIIKGSIAAKMQSWYGAVPKGSIFAKLTSIGMSA